MHHIHRSSKRKINAPPNCTLHTQAYTPVWAHGNAYTGAVSCGEKVWRRLFSFKAINCQLTRTAPLYPLPTVYIIRGKEEERPVRWCLCVLCVCLCVWVCGYLCLRFLPPFPHPPSFCQFRAYACWLAYTAQLTERLSFAITIHTVWFIYTPRAVHWLITLNCQVS